MASAARILQLINLETDLDQNVGGHAAPISGAVRFAGVDFGYNDDQPVLQQLSFDIKPGQTVAIVGQTGSGKTSLTRLINRIFDTQRGQVLVDGVDVRDWDLESLRRQIAVIEQDPFLFSRSVAENIAFGRPEASRQEVEAAAHAAQAHEFILELPEGCLLYTSPPWPCDRRWSFRRRTCCGAARTKTCRPGISCPPCKRRPRPYACAWRRFRRPRRATCRRRRRPTLVRRRSCRRPSSSSCLLYTSRCV